MPCSQEFIDFVCEQIESVGDVRYKKMFGEYMVYVDEKPILLVCDDTVYVKIDKKIKAIMPDAGTGIPYKGAKERFILDIDNQEQSIAVANTLLEITPLPKPKKPKKPKA